MRRFRLIPDDTRIDFVRRHLLAFAVSALMIAAAAGSLAIQGLNLGIDFRGGILVEAQARGGPVDLAALRTRLGGLGLGEVALQEFGAPDDLLIRVQRQEGGEAAQQQAVAAVRASLGDDFTVRRTEVIGPKVSGELLRDGYIAAALSVAGIAAYVALRFEWQYGLAAIIATVHDVVTVFGLYSLFGLEFNLTSVAAILTIAGYSINDTIVVFDRVRENMRRFRQASLTDLINMSVNQTLARTVLTSGTTMLSVLALVFFGGPVLFNFSIAFAVGIVVGTFSSIYVAAALLLYLPPVVRPEAAAATPQAEGRRPIGPVGEAGD